MSEHQPNDAFVRALLAQDGGLDEERYAAYRRQLDRKLEAARRPSLLHRRAWWVAGAVAAASVLVLLAWRPWRALGPDDRPHPKSLVVLRLPPPSTQLSVPYELELTADLIATATLGEPFQHDGETVAVLRLGRLLKETVAARDDEKGLPTFCCSYSGPETALSPDTYREGTRVLVYLGRSPEAGWSLKEIRPLGEGAEARELPGIERFLAVAAACESSDPRGEYRRLLAPEAGGLDLAACSALGCRPDPRSADVLLEQLERLRERIVREAHPVPGGRVSEEVSTTFTRLTDLLARLHEPRAARPVVECARRFPHGQRGPAYGCLPELCRSADEATRATVRTALIEEMEDPKIRPEDHGPAALALAAVADWRAVEVLVRRQGKRPITDANIDAARALAQLPALPAPTRREPAKEAWLALLRSYRPPPMPPDVERRLIREVVRLLHRQGLSAAQKKEVRKVAEESECPWFRRELTPLVR